MGSLLTEGSKTRALARRRKSGQDPGNAQRFLGAGVQISGRTRKRRPVCRLRHTPEKQRQGGELVCSRGHRKPLQWKPALNLPNHRKSKAQRGTPRPRGVGCSRAPAGERPTCPSHLRGLPTPAQHPHSAREPLHKPAPLSFSHLRTTVFLCLGGTSGAGRVRRGLTPGEHAAGRAPGYTPARLARQENRAVIQNKNTLEQQWELHLQVKRTFSKRREDYRRGAAARCLFMRQPVSPAL